MCGISGTVGRANAEALERMTQAILHRGPDQNGSALLSGGAAALGHTRLSIIDLSERGRQPMRDPSGRYWITYNGEVYNYRDLRAALSDYPFTSDTDTEVILAAFIRWGPDCLHRLTGMFAFAIWDEHENVLFAARDRIGIKPFYYAHHGDTFVFASEAKAIVRSGLVPVEPDWHALQNAGWYQVSPNTGFRGIAKLPPGTCLTLRDGRLTLRRYWNLAASEELSDPRAAAEQLDPLLRQCVADHMISDVPVGVLLSGGLDSSILVGIMAALGVGPITTFTIRFHEKDKRFERMPDDARYARIVAERFGCTHHEIVIDPDVTRLLPEIMWHLDEPLADPAAINTRLIARAARERGIYVLLNGTGGDEVFGGYRKYLAALLAGQYNRWVPSPLRSAALAVVDRLPVATRSRGLRTIRWAKRFLRNAALPEGERNIATLVEGAAEFHALYGGGHTAPSAFAESAFMAPQLATLAESPGSLLTRLCRCDTLHYLPDHNLTYSDKCSMAEGVEARPALVDHRLVEFMFRTAPDLRIRGRVQKYLLKKVAERYLPREIIYRPKAPFGSPLRSWIRGALAPLINETLAPDLLRRRGLYNADYVWRKIENDRRGTEDNSMLVWTVLCTELWMRRFFGD